MRNATARPWAPFAAILFLSAGCPSPPTTPDAPGAAADAPSDPPVGPPSAGPIPAAWVEARVAEARARLEGSEAGRLVWQAIEAHGGLDAWLSPGTLSFTFDYAPVDAPARRMHTRQRVDLWRARAVHEEVVGDGPTARFGWNGEVAWIGPSPDAFPISARFWALTPYYFVGMPFVLGDPGCRFELLDDAALDGRTWRQVKVTFAAGTGDAPDDYYVLYLDPTTHRLHALRYVVSYPGFVGKMYEAGGRTPETLMRYTEPLEVGGLTFFARLDTFVWDEEASAEVGKRVNVSAEGHILGAEVPGEAFDPPEGVQVLEGL